VVVCRRLRKEAVRSVLSPPEETTVIFPLVMRDSRFSHL
jgi:hypothetical protein